MLGTRHQERRAAFLCNKYTFLLSDGGKVGITIGANFIYPKSPWKISDILAAEIDMDFTVRSVSKSPI